MCSQFLQKPDCRSIGKDIPQVDVVVTMGCNVRCPFLPRSRREDWGLEDPTGSTDGKFIEIINKIEERIIELKDRLSD